MHDHQIDVLDKTVARKFCEVFLKTDVPINLSFFKVLSFQKEKDNLSYVIFLYVQQNLNFVHNLDMF